MDKFVKQGIDARRDAIFNAYELGEGDKKKVDALFKEIEELGASCKDSGEFEAKFASSPLNQRYLDLFTEVATSASPKTAAPKASMKEVGEMVAGGTAVGVAESAVDQAMRNVVPTRAAVHQKVSDEVRGVPVVGDAIDVAQKASYLGHLGKMFGGRKKKKEE